MVVTACDVWSDVFCFRFFGGMMIFTLIKVLFFVCIGVGIDIVGGEGFLGDCGVLFFVLMMF